MTKNKLIRLAPTPPVPELKTTLDAVLEKILSRKIDPKRVKKQEQFEQERSESVTGLARFINGSPLENATLDTYETYNDNQHAVLERIRNIQDNMKKFMQNRHKIALIGTVGTGKDHLIVSLLKTAESIGYRVGWFDGLELYDKIKSNIRERNYSPEYVFDRMTRFHVLCISEPFVDRNWKETNSQYLSRIVRDRYRRNLPTWITANFESHESMRDKMRENGIGDVYSRMIDNSVRILCKWPCYRTKNLPKGF